mmetsp:Transcript_4121/g.6771  ORF Transcript_4121/g.6771 Transcript_4121/m.6771 type:complete len:579 (-) Transcript_4121:341-2077(-)
MGRRAKKTKAAPPPRSSNALGSGDPDDDGEVFEVEGVIHEGEMLLVDKRTHAVYACERGPAGEFVKVGKWDPTAERVTLLTSTADADEHEEKHEQKQEANLEDQKEEEEEEDLKAAKLQRIIVKAVARGDEVKAAAVQAKLARHQEKTMKQVKQVSVEKTAKKRKASEAIVAPMSSALVHPAKRARTAVPFGKYFPSATLVPGAVYAKDAKISILLFYQYIEPVWTEQKQKEAIKLTVDQGADLNLGGRVRVAQEGFNSTISGLASDVRAFAEALKRWDPAHFCDTHFKFIDDLHVNMAFKDLSVFPVTELVTYGLGGEKAPPLSGTATHLLAEAYHKKMQEPNTVIIDVRNAYESAIGHFVPPATGAQLIDPCMRQSTDFPSWLAAEATQKQLEGKQVLMYCTGGVRCERASALLSKELGSRVAGVFQLQGGVEQYLLDHPGDGGFWKGKNFTFDKRNAISAYGQSDNQGNAEVMGECAACGVAWDRYEGKKKCTACSVPLLVCRACLSKQVDKDPSKREAMRCPLCKEQVAGSSAGPKDRPMSVKQKGAAGGAKVKLSSGKETTNMAVGRGLDVCF